MKNNFYDIVNGEWLEKTRIPHDKSKWGTFNILDEDNTIKILNLLDGTNNDVSYVFRKLMAIDSYTDEENIVELTRILDIIGKTENLKEVGIIMGFLTKLNIQPFMSISVNEDLKDANTTRTTLWISDLSMPEKKYYCDRSFNKYRKGLINNIVNLFTYLDYSEEESENIANDVLFIEKFLILAQKSVTMRRNMDKLYEKMTINDFINMVSKGNKILSDTWRLYFECAGISKSEFLVIYDSSYFRKIAEILARVDLNKIKNYLKYAVVKTLGCVIIGGIDDILIEFYGMVMEGYKKKPKRERRVLQLLNNLVGELIGKMYVEKYFDEKSKRYMEDMVVRIKEEMRLSIINLEWMCNKTKENALLKLANLKIKIGYPDKWRDFTGIFRQEKNLMNFFINIRLFKYDMDVLKLIDKEKDPDKWSMDAHNVNAYYEPSRNEMVFPAGILQSPFFNINSSLGENYGGIGIIIAHEIVHGFDDQGRKYDHNGNLNDWWCDSDSKKYNALAKKLTEQYNQYEIRLLGKIYKINGELTLGENIADLGGINLAYRAMNRYDNITLKDKQEFFISYAKVWRMKFRPESLISLILSDPHSPGKHRVFNLRNVNEFYETFKDLNLDNMYLEPDKRIKIW